MTAGGEPGPVGDSLRPASGLERAAAAGARAAFPIEPALWRRLVEAEEEREFAEAWLELVARSLPDARVGVLLLGEPDRGPYALAARWPRGRAVPQELARAAERALSGGRAVTLRRQADDGERGLLAWPLVFEGELHGACAFELGARDDAQLAAAARQVQWGAAWIELRRARGGPADANVRLAAVLELCAAAAEREGFLSAASAFVTRLAARMGCERVALGFARGGRMRLMALSHSADFGGKTNLVRAVEAAMDEACDQEQPVLQPAPDDAPFQVRRAHAELLSETGAGAACTVPIGREGRVFGALTLEREDDEPFGDADLELIEVAAGLVGPLLELERRQEQGLASRAWEATRERAGRLARPGHDGAKLLAVAGLAVALFLAFAKGEHRVSADAVIEASVRRVAVAPFDAYVLDAPLRAGDLVEEGGLLARLDDRDLLVERERLRSQREQLRRQHSRALAQKDRAQMRISDAQVGQVEAQLELVDERLARSRVLSPIAGIVVTGDLTQALGAPVQRGEVLFEVAPLEDFEVVLHVDERDVSDVRPGQRGRLLLSAFPGDPVPFEVLRVTPASVTKEDLNYFRVEARLEGEAGRLRPGMEGIGKVDVGRRRYVWIWTHRAVEWARNFLWRWMP